MSRGAPTAKTPPIDRRSAKARAKAQRHADLRQHKLDLAAAKKDPKRQHIINARSVSDGFAHVGRLVAKGRTVTISYFEPVTSRPTAEALKARSDLRGLSFKLVSLLTGIAVDDLPDDRDETGEPVLPSVALRRVEDWPPAKKLTELYVERARLLNIIHAGDVDRWCEDCGDTFVVLKAGTGNLCQSCTSTRRSMRRATLKQRGTKLTAEIKKCSRCSPSRLCSDHKRRAEQLADANARGRDAMQNYDPAEPEAHFDAHARAQHEETDDGGINAAWEAKRRSRASARDPKTTK